MTTVANLSERRIRAGAPSPADERHRCAPAPRPSFQWSKPAEREIAELWARPLVPHTRTPPEREYAEHDRDPKARAVFWWAIFAAYAAVAVGGYFYIFGA